MCTRRVWLAFAAGIVVGAVAIGARVSFALNPGDPVSVLIPASGNQPEPDPGPPTDKLIYTGGRVTTVDAAGCQVGSFPLQNGVLVDPAAGRGGRIEGVITLTGDAVPPGTKLKTFNFVTDCTAGGIAYKRYTAVVE